MFLPESDPTGDRTTDFPTLDTASPSRGDRRRRRALVILSLGLLLLLIRPPIDLAAEAGSRVDERDRRRIAIELGTGTFDLVTFDVESARVDPSGVAALPERLAFELPLEGNERRVTLARRSVRAEDFRLLVQDATGALVEREAPPSATYAGTVDADADSRVAASLDERGRLRAIVWTGSGRTFELLPVPDAAVSDRMRRDVHVIAPVDSVDRPVGGVGSCGVSNVAEQDGFAPPATPDPRSSRGTPLVVCDLAVDCDVEFFDQNGSNVNNTLRDVERVVNGCRTIFERDAGITYEVTVIVVRTAEPDPYTSADADTLLDEFRSHWNNSELDAIRRDTAHLMTGRSLFAPTIGVARVGTICTRSASYGLSQSRFSPMLVDRVALTAHELAHAWNAPHCEGGGCHIMCASIGGCSGDLTRFSQPIIDGIVAYREGRGCLDPAFPPVTLPFFDEFATNTPDPARWTYVEGPRAITGGGEKPSEPRALNLDADNGDPYRDDEIRTNALLAGGAPSVYAQYFVNHRGVEAGEALVVEYFSAIGVWESLDRIVSDGTDPALYTYRGMRLSPLAQHDGLRLRFRSEVDQGNDDWFVDDVRVCASPITITATPVASVVAPGQPILFDVRVENRTATPQPYTAWLDAIRADGVVFSGNPVLGPRSATLGAGRAIERRVRLRVPSSAPPSGPHLIRVAIGNYPVPCAVATFPVTVAN